MKRFLLKQLAFALIIAMLLPAIGLADDTANVSEEAQFFGTVQDELPAAEGMTGDEPEITVDSEEETVGEQEVMFDGFEDDGIEENSTSDSTDETPIENTAIPFDQEVTVGDISIQVIGTAGCFPEGSTLEVEQITDDEIAQAIETALSSEGTYTHNLYRVVIRDAAGNVILPNESNEAPMVCVKGPYAAAATRVVMFDNVSKSSFEIESNGNEGEVTFAFVASAIYDLMISKDSDEQQAGTFIEEPSQGESEGENPTDEQPGDKSENEEQPQDETTDADSTEEEPEDEAVEGAEVDESQAVSDDAALFISEEALEESKDAEDGGEWINTAIEHIGGDSDLGAIYEGESANLANSQFAAQAVTYDHLPSVLIAGDVIDLKQCILYENYNPAEVTSWKSSKTKVVKISKAGILTAVKAGKAKITVKTKNRKKRTLSVRVQSNSIGLFSKPSKGEAVALGNTFSIRPKSLKYSGTKLVASFYLLNGSKKEIRAIRGLNLSVFAGNRNNKIASQSFSKIKVKGKKKGVSTFKVTFSGGGVLQNNVHFKDYSADKIYFDLDTSAVYASVKKGMLPFVATVIPNVPAPVLVSGISLSSGSLSLKVGQRAQIGASVQPGDAENKAVTWTSSNGGVVSVDGSGAVTAISEGTATITATAADGGGASAACTVTVSSAVVRATSVSFSPATINIKVGESATITGTVLPTNVSNADLQLFSSTSGIVQVERHTVNGNVNTITVKGLKSGSTKLTGYTADNITKTAECTINVSNTNASIVSTPVSFSVSHPDLSGRTLTMSPDASAVSDKVDAGYSTLTINSNTVWTATLSSDSFVKFLGDGSTATVNSNTSARASAGNGIKLKIKLVKTPNPGKTSTATLTFNVGSETYQYTITQTKPEAEIPASSTTPDFNVQFTNPTMTIALGSKALIQGTLSISGGSGYIGKVTVNAFGYTDSKLPNGEGRKEDDPSEDFTGQNRTQIKFQDWAGFWIDTSKPPYNEAKSYTMQVWAKDSNGAGGDQPVATMELKVTENTSELTNAQVYAGINTYFAGSSDKLKVARRIADILLPDFEPAFIAGVLGNVQSEGNIGQFEFSGSVSAGQNGSARLQWLRDNYDYSNQYGGKYIYNGFSLNTVKEMSTQMMNWTKKNYPSYDALFGLGFSQWTSYNRNISLIALYLSESKGNDTITKDQALEAEAKMLAQELNGGYKAIYNSWKNNGYSSMSNAAYCAGVMFCQQYEKPNGTHYAAVGAKMLSENSIDKVRGNQAESLYNAMKNS